MKASLLTVVCLLSFFASSLAEVDLHISTNEIIEGQYIVVFKSTSSKAERDQHVALFQKLAQESLPEEASLIDTFEIDEFAGYIAKIPLTLLAKLRQHQHLISYIETDSVVHANQNICYLQKDATWGIDRINHRALDLDNTYVYHTTKTDVEAYVIDTGIYIEHTDFGGRAVWGANFVDQQDTDCNGHGTHVAGTIGSTTYGVAKNVSLIAVKVLNCQGSGTNSGVIQGIQYTATKAKKKTAVANMSLGGGFSKALNDAVDAAVKAGVFFAVAAGNENTDACTRSPASASLVVSVGATTVEAGEGTTQNDQRAYFSNFGSCVDIFAPGQFITSTWIGSPIAIETISGTSMASPHVAGAAAVYLGDNPSSSPSDTMDALLNSATTNEIEMSCVSEKSICRKSPNKLLYSTCTE